MRFCTTERPQLFEFEVATCRTCRLRSKNAMLEVATSNFQKLGANLTPPNVNSKSYFMTTLVSVGQTNHVWAGGSLDKQYPLAK